MLRRPTKPAIEYPGDLSYNGVPSAPKWWHMDRGSFLVIAMLVASLGIPFLLGAHTWKTADRAGEQRGIETTNEQWSLFQDNGDLRKKVGKLEANLSQIGNMVSSNNELLSEHGQALGALGAEMAAVVETSEGLVAQMKEQERSGLHGRLNAIYAESKQVRAKAHELLGTSGPSSIFQPELPGGAKK